LELNGRPVAKKPRILAVFRYFKALLSVIFVHKPENAGFSGVIARSAPIEARLGSI